MEQFVKGETQILVATTVIEVGVNVPNASVMVIPGCTALRSLPVAPAARPCRKRLRPELLHSGNQL